MIVLENMIKVVKNVECIVIVVIVFLVVIGDNVFLIDFKKLFLVLYDDSSRK